MTDVAQATEALPGPRLGLISHPLDIDPRNPLVFDVPSRPGELVAVVPRLDRGTILGSQQQGKLVPHLVILGEIDAPEVTRRFVLMPGGRFDRKGNWEGGWIPKLDEVKFCRLFVSPIDGMPIAVFELPVGNPEEVEPPPGEIGDAPVDPDAVAAILAKVRELDATDPGKSEVAP